MVSWDGLHLIWILKNTLEEALKSSEEGKRIFQRGRRARGHTQSFDSPLRSRRWAERVWSPTSSHSDSRAHLHCNSIGTNTQKLWYSDGSDTSRCQKAIKCIPQNGATFLILQHALLSQLCTLQMHSNTWYNLIFWHKNPCFTWLSLTPLLSGLINCSGIFLFF